MCHEDFTDNQKDPLLQTPSHSTEFFLKAFVGYKYFPQRIPTMWGKHERIYFCRCTRRGATKFTWNYPRFFWIIQIMFLRANSCRSLTSTDIVITYLKLTSKTAETFIQKTTASKVHLSFNYHVVKIGGSGTLQKVVKRTFFVILHENFLDLLLCYIKTRF